MKRYKYDKTRILVTGGAGFLGSHLCENLITNGNTVICLDNFYTGTKTNILHLLKNENFEIIRHDIINPITLEVDQIYNLACPASPQHYQTNPIKTTETSVIGAINMLNLANNLKASILQTSTSEVYGDPSINPQKENYWGNVNIIGIRSCYDEGKRCAESLFFDYYRQYDIDIKVIRIFNTYGPKMHPEDGRVISNFIIQALKNENITIYGDGSQTRSFCYVDDLINGMLKMMNSPKGFTGPINLGNPDEYNMKDLANLIIYLTDSKSNIEYKSLPMDDPKKRQPDITLAKEKLDWKPNIKLEEGLKETIKYFKNII